MYSVKRKDPVRFEFEVDPTVHEAELGKIGDAPQLAPFGLLEVFEELEILVDAASYLVSHLDLREERATLPQSLELRETGVQVCKLNGSEGQSKHASSEQDVVFQRVGIAASPWLEPIDRCSGYSASRRRREKSMGRITELR